MVSELDTQQSRDTSSKEIFQQADKGNEDLVSQNVIGSDEKINPQQKEIPNEKDHPFSQNINDQTKKMNESLQPTDKE